MKIVFTGGGSGGHFYPLIAVAEEVHAIVHERKLISPKLYYLGPTPFEQSTLFEQQIEFRKIPAGRLRRYFTLTNFSDVFVTVWGIMRALVTLFSIYPDVIFSKGGFVSVPVTFAGKLLGIPIVIHDSDSKPGRANVLASSYATHIAISFPDAAKYFPEKTRGKIAYTGTPIRKTLASLDATGARELLHLDEDVPVVLVVTGSLGSQAINDTVIDGLSSILKNAYVIHQTGKTHI